MNAEPFRIAKPHPFTFFKMASTWSEEETLKLIEVWGEGAIQAMLEGSKRNKGIFVRISQTMEASGYQKTGEQCNTKIKKLRFEYKKIKDKKGKTGEGLKCWKYFEAMDSILGHKPATQPPVLVESSHEGISDHSGLAEETTSVTNEIEETTSSTTSDGEPISQPGTPVVEPVVQKVISHRKRKKASDNFEKMEEFVSRIMKMQEESDRKYMQLEEKMLKLEEKRLKDSHEFQMHLVSLLSQQQGPAYVQQSQGQFSRPSYYSPYYINTTDNNEQEGEY